MQRKGFTLTESLIIGALFSIIVVIGTLALSAERARTRDMKRLADITRIGASFAILYARDASYAAAANGCDQVGDLVKTCRLPAVVPGLSDIQDPGKFTYTVSRVPDTEDFGVRFRLERSAGSLSAGFHVLTKAGVR